MVVKFSGTGYSANSLNLDFLRDNEGNPLQTPNSFLVLHNPVRLKINEIINWIASLVALNLSDNNGILFYKGNPVGIGFGNIDGGCISDNYVGTFISIDAGLISENYTNDTFKIDGGKM